MKEIDILQKGVQTRAIQFKHDYSLRPWNTHSFTKDSYGGLSVFSGNPNAGCLTLKEVDIYDSQNNQTAPIVFSYGYNPSITQDLSSDYNQFAFMAVVPICNPSCFVPVVNAFYRIEEKDIWGYYCRNRDPAHPGRVNNANDFNATGFSTRSIMSGTDQIPYASAWSLQKITFPTGMWIKWDYETNRYNKANNCEIKDQAGNPVNRYGGGIRVKKITINDGWGKLNTLNYYYSNGDPGQFDDNTYGTSGHATVEPYNYISNAEYRTDTRTRGGLYTPAKVAYEKVQIVKGYKSASPNAPFGFTQMEFYTSKDFPNEGQYGDIDNSWKRGGVKRIAQYNSTNNLVSVKHYFYAFEQGTPTQPLSTTVDLDYKCDNRYFNTGWIRITDEKDTLDNVESVRSFKYSPDYANAADKVTQTRTIFQFNEKTGIKVDEPHPPGCSFNPTNYYCRRYPPLVAFNHSGSHILDIYSVIPYDQLFPDNMNSECSQTKKVYLEIRIAKGVDVANSNLSVDKATVFL